MPVLFSSVIVTRRPYHTALAVVGIILSMYAVNGYAQDRQDISARQIELLAASCANCHGTDGRLETSIPAIANRSVRVLEAQLLAFKYDDQPQVTVMDRIAKGYSEAQLKALAEYFATLDSY